MIKALFKAIGILLSIVYPKSIQDGFEYAKVLILTSYYKNRFGNFGTNSLISASFLKLVGARFINIGNDTVIRSNVELTAWERYKDEMFEPQIRIGNGCSVGDFAHITSINLIDIGNNVRMGKNVLITDNAHGKSDSSLFNISPQNRPLYSKGPVVIEDNVWIGDKVSIMPGVRIGKGSIIGANTVVTKSIPPFSIAVGNPVRILKSLDSD